LELLAESNTGSFSVKLKSDNMLTDSYQSIGRSQASVGGCVKESCICCCRACSKYWRNPRWYSSVTFNV